MSNQIIGILLPLCLAIVMAGLGLELTIKDFIRVKDNPKAVMIALFCQLIILVPIAFVISKVLNLPPLLAVGLMMLAASPGGATANLFSYLYKGDLALNITLTAVNALIAAFTFPLIVNFAIAHFASDGQHIGLQLSKVIQVFAIILIPVSIGMLIRHIKPNLAHKLERFVRIFASVFLVLIIIGAIAAERANFLSYFYQVGLAAIVFCFLSLSIGYWVPKLVGVPAKQARACAFEIGIHNSTLAMTVAITLMNSAEIAIPAAVYSIVMYVLAILFGTMLNKLEPLSEQKLSGSN